MINVFPLRFSVAFLFPSSSSAVTARTRSERRKIWRRAVDQSAIRIESRIAEGAADEKSDILRARS